MANLQDFRSKLPADNHIVAAVRHSYLKHLVTAATEHSSIEAFIKDISVAAATATKGATVARVVIREVAADSSVLGYS